jgi:hypothetical protein
MKDLDGRILARLRTNPRLDRVAWAGDFAGLAPGSEVRKALRRLCRSGKVRSLARGFYGADGRVRGLKAALPPGAHALIAAYGRKHNLAFLTSPAEAANLAGMSTQVPARVVVLARVSRPVSFMGGRARILPVPRELRPLFGREPHAALVCLGLWWERGEPEEGPRALDSLARRLPEAAKADLRDLLRRMPEWMRPAIERACREA